MVHIIGISGKAGVGKDFITQKYLIPILARNRPYAILSFADNLKIECIVKERLPREKVYGQKDAYTRNRLQQRGTEEGRNVFGENIWIDMLNERIIQYEKRGIEIIFITDCRFPNEIKYVQSRNGFIILIEAPDRNQRRREEEKREEKKGDGGHSSLQDLSLHSSLHSSETSLNHLPPNTFDFILHNSENDIRFVEEITLLCNILVDRIKYKETIFLCIDFLDFRELIEDHFNLLLLRPKHIVLYTFGNQVDKIIQYNNFPVSSVEVFYRKGGKFWIDRLLEKYPSHKYQFISHNPQDIQDVEFYNIHNKYLIQDFEQLFHVLMEC